jgi:hypothetical protein
MPTSDKMPATFNKSDLNTIHRNNSSLLKNRLIDKEANNIKYQVLQQNNLGHKTYVHSYTFSYNELLVDDYFADILNKLIIIFPDSTIEYTTNINSSHETKIYNNSSMTSSSTRPKYINNGNHDVNNTITIDWS